MSRSAAIPFTRPALLTFVWSHRRTITRWGRSFWNELRQPGHIDARRLALIGTVLMTITRNERLAQARQLRQVRLDGSTLVVDASRNWTGTARLVDELSGIDGITAITDVRGRPLRGTIATTAAG